MTGVTADGVSASVVTAGVLNTGEVSIMNNDKSTFRWNSVGLTAFKTKESGTNDGESVLDKTFLDTFVRFDQNGIYGFMNSGKDGSNYQPSAKEIEEGATFALTGEGLKVSGNNGAVARIGKFNYKDGEEDKTAIIKINNGTKDTFYIGADGEVSMSGNLNVDTGGYSWKFDKDNGAMMWAGAQGNGQINGDPNLLFKIYKEDGKGKLWLGGNAVFNGIINATGGNFSGSISSTATISGGTISGSTISGGTISGSVIKIGGTTSNPNFEVDQYGNVTLKGNITWGTSNRPDTSVDRDDFLDLLESGDGIYVNSNNKIRINASYISTGAINIGGTSTKNYRDAKFYADIANKNVYLSGFEFSGNKLKNSVFRQVNNYGDGDGFTIELDASKGTLRSYYGSTWGVNSQAEYGVSTYYYNRGLNNYGFITLQDRSGNKYVIGLATEDDNTEEGYVKWVKY